MRTNIMSFSWGELGWRAPPCCQTAAVAASRRCARRPRGARARVRMCRSGHRLVFWTGGARGTGPGRSPPGARLLRHADGARTAVARQLAPTDRAASLGRENAPVASDRGPPKPGEAQQPRRREDAPAKRRGGAARVGADGLRTRPAGGLGWGLGAAAEPAPQSAVANPRPGGWGGGG